MNKIVRSPLLLSAAVIVGIVGSAEADSRRHTSGGPSMTPQGVKVFQWGENVAGDCHQTGATLELHPNGTASFKSMIWTHTHGTDVWHATIHLYGPGGVDYGNSGSHDSPGMPHNHDGPENPVPLNFQFNFPPGSLANVVQAVEESAC